MQPKHIAHEYNILEPCLSIWTTTTTAEQVITSHEIMEHMDNICADGPPSPTMPYMMQFKFCHQGFTQIGLCIVVQHTIL